MRAPETKSPTPRRGPAPNRGRFRRGLRPRNPAGGGGGGGGGGRPPPPREELADSPGVAGDQELRDVTGPPLGDRRPLLLEEHLLVRGRLDLHEDADRDREGGGAQLGQDVGLPGVSVA